MPLELWCDILGPPGGYIFIAVFKCLTISGKPFLLFIWTLSKNISSDGSNLFIKVIVSCLSHSDLIMSFAVSIVSFAISFLLMIGKIKIFASGHNFMVVESKLSKSSFFTAP